MVWFWVERSGLTAIWRGFELYECLLVLLCHTLYVVDMTAVRPVVSRVSSIRQRSRSGDSSPVCLSQGDITASGNVAMAIASSAISSSLGLVRCSSDSNILIDSDRHKGQFVLLTSSLLNLVRYLHSKEL